MDGIRFMARRGRRTRTVRMAERLRLPTAGRYSTALQGMHHWHRHVNGRRALGVLPRDHDEGVQSVPVLGQIGAATAAHSHRHHLDQHLEGKEDEDEVVKGLEEFAARGVADHVSARMVHPQRHAVHDDGHHGDPLEPRNGVPVSHPLFWFPREIAIQAKSSCERER